MSNMYGEHIASLQQSVRELQSAMDSLGKIVGGHPKTPHAARIPHHNLHGKNIMQELGGPLLRGMTPVFRGITGGGGDFSGASQGQALAEIFSMMSRAMQRNL
ncbi:MAG: hypothetical protein KGI29_10170 [Pseudomonadota bacterium]|nr:hypothetical protein [Pseudomonadota bacterium]MDE3037133.1 hypothetical protein [Pseudomonadota bacterium]